MVVLWTFKTVTYQRGYFRVWWFSSFATSYYIVQRTCKTRLFAPYLAWFTFWGWQAVIVAAVLTLPLGLTSAKEYAELEWPIDIGIALVWVAYAVVFLAH